MIALVESKIYRLTPRAACERIHLRAARAKNTSFTAVDSPT